MQYQSTAPLARPARHRGPPAFIGFALAIVIVGAGLGVAAYAISQPAPVLSGPQTAPTPAPSQPSVDPLSIGTHGSFGVDMPLWVEEIAVSAYRRADGDRDSKGTSQILGLYEMLIVPAQTPVRITNRHGATFQVEILGSGALAGRRGWTDAGVLFTRQL